MCIRDRLQYFEGADGVWTTFDTTLPYICLLYTSDVYKRQRLRHVVSDVPKPMAPVCGRPFLQYILDDLINKGVGRAVLAVGYRADVIEGFFGRAYNGLSLAYSREETPLFTGGAVKKAPVSYTHLRNQVLYPCGKMENHKGERMRLCFYACASFCTERKYCLGVMPYSCLNARKK